ncbi:MAG: ribosome small subunit-dependent GTPase A [Spirochaetes bacterium]|jgi:ribosome biogenesis GTPase|nr:ribosome small subunit-dependent GTPase A [Spirochaetota bacterium]
MLGLVTKAMGRFYTVFSETGFRNCGLRGRLRLDEGPRRFTNPVAVGDMVDFEIGEGESGTIKSVRERKNVFSRMESSTGKEDIIAANLDQIVVVQSFRSPKLNLRFVDRILVRSEKEGIRLVLCVNKLDLAGEGELDYIKKYYRGSGAVLVATSAVTGEGMDLVGKEMGDRLSLLVGSSGVGKSSILNRIYPGLNLRISEISESTGKGRHTTTNVEMIMAGDGTRIIDTPGLKEFGLNDINPPDLGCYFSDFDVYSGECGFRPCTHDHEPGCEVKKMVENGTIHPDRYVSYLNILYSLKEHHDRKYR